MGLPFAIPQGLHCPLSNQLKIENKPWHYSIRRGALRRTHLAWANHKNIGDSHLQAEYSRYTRILKLTTNSSWLVPLQVKEDTSGWERSQSLSPLNKSSLKPFSGLANSQEMLVVLRLLTEASNASSKWNATWPSSMLFLRDHMTFTQNHLPPAKTNHISKSNE